MSTETTVAAPAAILPPSVSADGKRNAYYTQCADLQSTKPYAMCQYIIDRKSDASMQTLYGDCHTAIRRGTCAAVGMREEEQLKGQAIYFVERVKGSAVVAQQSAWVAPSKSSYRRDKYATGASAIPAPKAGLRPMSPMVEKKAAAPVFDGNIYAAALNAAVKKNQNATNRQAAAVIPAPAAVAPVPPPPVSKPVAAPVAVAPITIRAGESPLEMARRLRAAQTQT
jgi:hypothetical protein